MPTMPTKRDYYEVLEVERGAEVSAIKAAYRKKARQYHPDVNKETDAEERFKEVQEAYEVLSDDQKRARYDRFGHEGMNGGNGGFPGGMGQDPFGGFGDIFDVFFGGAGGGQRRGGPQRGADLRYDLEITLEEAYSGIEKTIRIPRVETCDTCKGSGAAAGSRPETCGMCSGQGQVRRMQNTILGTIQSLVTCPQCNGRGETVKNPCADCGGQGRTRKQRDIVVSVPPGVDNDMQMPLRGQGESGAFGGPAGDLYVFFHLKEHELFEREGLDLFTHLPLTFSQAALGDNIPVPTISGEKGSITVPEGTQPGRRFRLRGLGMPDVRDKSRRGDLHVVVTVQVPTKLSDKERELIRQLATLRGEKPGETPAPISENKGFFARLKEAFTGQED
jgi:molecular chaperone DnaJ